MDARVARRYSRALFNTARDQQCLADVSADLAVLVGAFESDEGFRNLLLSPLGDHLTKTQALSGLLERLAPITADFLRLLLEKRREDLLPQVRVDFEELKHEYEHTTEATVMSAIPLDDAQRAAILRELEAKSGMHIDPTFVVDEGLIGGVRALMGEEQIDGTVKGRLGKMRKRLFRDLLRQT